MHIEEEYEITWASIGSIEHVRIEYSTDNFATTHIIIVSTNNDGSYTWTVYGPPSETVRFRIVDTDNPAINDVSETVSLIAKPDTSANTLYLPIVNNAHTAVENDG